SDGSLTPAREQEYQALTAPLTDPSSWLLSELLHACWGQRLVCRVRPRDNAEANGDERGEEMTGGEFLLKVLRNQGLSHVFLVPGGHIDPLVAELGKGVGLQPIVAAHEQGAGFMADGYARVSGRFGACLGIGGPGAANLLPAAVAARSDGSRVMLITGDVPSSLQGRGGFQDGSIRGPSDAVFLRQATVYSEEVELPSQLPRQLAAAFRAMFGVPSGPAHLSVPTDVQQASLAAGPDGSGARWEPARPVDAEALARVAEQVLGGATRLAVPAGPRRGAPGTAP